MVRTSPTRNQGACTLLARWAEGYKDPCLILTDLAPEASDAGWNGLRAWIEQGFKITKRAGWQWHRTGRARPTGRRGCGWHASVATLWLLSVGEAADETIPASTLLDVTALCPERPRRATGAAGADAAGEDNSCPGASGRCRMVRMLWRTRARSSALASLPWTRASPARPVCRFRARPRTSLRRVRRCNIGVATAVQRRDLNGGEAFGFMEAT